MWMAWEIDQKCLAIVWVWTGLILFFLHPVIVRESGHLFSGQIPRYKVCCRKYNWWNIWYSKLYSRNDRLLGMNPWVLSLTCVLNSIIQTILILLDLAWLDWTWRLVLKKKNCFFFLRWRVSWINKSRHGIVWCLLRRSVNARNVSFTPNLTG